MLCGAEWIFPVKINAHTRSRRPDSSNGYYQHGPQGSPAQPLLGKSCAFGEGQAIKNGTAKSPEGAELATEDPSNGGSAYPARE